MNNEMTSSMSFIQMRTFWFSFPPVQKLCCRALFCSQIVVHWHGSWEQDWGIQHRNACAATAHAKEKQKRGNANLQKKCKRIEKAENCKIRANEMQKLRNAKLNASNLLARVLVVWFILATSTMSRIFREDFRCIEANRQTYAYHWSENHALRTKVISPNVILSVV